MKKVVRKKIIRDARKTAPSKNGKSKPRKDRPKLKYSVVPGMNKKSKKAGGKKRPDFSPRRAGAGARRAGTSSGSKSGRASKSKAKAPRPKKEIKTYAAWVVFDNHGNRVETFPYHDRPAAERCLAKQRGRRLKDGNYENGTFYVNLVKESQ